MCNHNIQHIRILDSDEETLHETARQYADGNVIDHSTSRLRRQRIIDGDMANELIKLQWWNVLFSFPCECASFDERVTIETMATTMKSFMSRGTRFIAGDESVQRTQF
jgi:hypothetical protein